MLSLPTSSANRAILKGYKGTGSPPESAPISSVQSNIVKDDLSNFTVDKWRNKIFTDPRVRSKLKDRNYRVKIIEDVELTRAAVLKLIPKTLLESMDGVIALGTESVLFEAYISSPYHVQAVVKVWNKPAKQLMEAKKPLYEDDLEFVEQLNRSPNADFRELWAEREMKMLEKLSQNGIKCPKGIACIKNVLIMERQDPPLIEQEANTDPKYRQSSFNNVLSTMKLLYTSGFIHGDLSEKNVTSTGIIYDVHRVVSRRSPNAEDLLYKSCTNFYKFIKPLELKKPDSPESIFFDITGTEYSPKKPLISKPDSPERAIRKMERKSERSVKNANQ